MTRPIYEPTQTRADAFLDYQQKQLFRRPAQPSDSFVVESALWYDGAGAGETGTVNNNTLTDIICNSRFISTGSTAFATDQGLPTARCIKAVADGWYLGYINFEWAGSTYTDQRTYSLFQNNGADNCGDQNMVETASSPFINAAFNGTFGPMYIRGASLSSSYFKTRVQHAAGSAQTIAGVVTTVIYLGPDLDQAGFPPF